MAKILIGEAFFEHLLNCMCNQKYVHEQSKEVQEEWQEIIDTAYHKARGILAPRIEIGDKVRNIRDGKLGIVIRIFKSGSIAVLENVAPVVITTHDSYKTLEVVERNSVVIFDETKEG